MPNLFEHYRDGVSWAKPKIRISQEQKLACILPSESIFFKDTNKSSVMPNLFEHYQDGVSWAKPKIRISREQKLACLHFPEKYKKVRTAPYGCRCGGFSADEHVLSERAPACVSGRRGPEPASQAVSPAAYGREFVRLFRRPGQGNIESKNVDNNEKIVYLRTFVSAAAVRAALPALLRRAEAAAAAAETWRGR